MSIKRIEQMESILDKAAELMDDIDKDIVRLAEYQAKIAKLEAYYESREWKDDFELDEKGAFPDDLKRGVLSEDAVYDLLERNKELMELYMTNGNSPRLSRERKQ